MSIEWEEVQLGNLAELVRGVSYKPTDLKNANDSNAVALLRATNIGEKRLELKDFVYVPANFVKSAQRLKIFDIIIAMSSGSRSAVGRLAQLKNNFDGTIGAFCGAIRPNPELVNPKFLGYVLHSPQFRSRIDTYASGTAIMNLTKDSLLGFQVKLPPKNLQNQISDLLSVLDERVNLLLSTNSVLEAVAKELFKSWFIDFDPVRAKADGRLPDGMNEVTAELFPDSFEESNFGLIPKGWISATISEISTFQNGYAFKSSDWSDSGFPVVKIGNVKPMIIDLENCSYVEEKTVANLDRFKLNAGDLLVGMTGYVGETGLVPHSYTPGYLNQRVGRIAPKDNIRDLGFLFSALRQKSFKNFAENQSHGSAQANVSGSDLMKYPAVIPGKLVLEKFNEVTFPLIESILENHNKAQCLSEIRDQLLPRLISGQLRLPDSEAEFDALTA